MVSLIPPATRNRVGNRAVFVPTRTATGMYESGAFVADHVEPLREGQVQPNGVDLTVDAVYEQTAPGRIERGDKRVGDRRELRPVNGDGDGAGEYRLDPGAYVVQYGETLRVPDGHVGFVYPRSSLLRNSCMLNTAVWDAGYEGRGEGLLQVGHALELERGARVAQFVLSTAEHDGRYDGDYQGERLSAADGDSDDDGGDDDDAGSDAA
ncbi:deoxyuridine 5'-triphosphate nucleotidohydrolase [Halobaculum sp. D14]|uniref:deoxyuridine 5'-triphosphate nucleotidohydrolase n=1 Tax=Halobaculum sp. D14 TaxID=3421642 RepID=UPI003EBF25F0